MKPVSLWIRLVVGLLGGALVVLVVVPGGIVPPGLGQDSGAALSAGYLYTSRNAALGIGMLLAALLGRPSGIMSVLAIRFLLEISDRIAMNPLFPTLEWSNLLPPLAPAAIELVLFVFAARAGWRNRR